MTFKRCSISLVLLLGICLSGHAALEFTESEASDALVELDDSLRQRERFIARRQASIDRMRDSLHASSSENERIDLLLKIGKAYTAFNNDSALHYFSEGINHAPDRARRIPFMINSAMLLPLGGTFTGAQALYDSISPAEVPEEYLKDYYDAGRQMYSYMAEFHPDGSRRQKLYRRKALENQNELLKHVPRNSNEYQFNLGELHFLNGERGKATALLEEVFNREPIHSNLRAKAAHHLAEMANDRGDSPTYTYYLAEAALADVSAATREVAALQELGNHMYSQNDVNRSYNYLTAALANAVECGAAMRMIESSRSLPLIERAKLAQLNAQRRSMYVVLAILIMVALVLALTMGFLRNEMVKMRRLQESLRAANKTKEVYISQFLSLCSIYMDKLNQFCNLATRKIAAGQVDELYRLTKNGKFIEEQSREFYEVFDNAFLHLYPNFVQEVNALLLPDKQIELAEGEVLNTDLRILAFMRLGIEESSRIAQVLNYSINTIYAYRNRTKSRAINRDTFEDDVMKINA
ncbi:MAG: hypothetical protein K2M19_08020 [Muribaculaceae bacterium]|nr:hypothetical protein [Muribaculaceae bacterium]